MTWAWAIPSAIGGATVGFFIGVRYCAARLLPGIMARLTPERLTEVAKQAQRVRDGKE